MPITSNIDDFTKAFSELATEFEKIPDLSLNYVGDVLVKQMQSIAPVDTGKLKRGIKKIKNTRNTMTVISEALYSAAVDKGHKTRQGTGRAPGYRPKPGGISFVPANPFFTKPIKQLQQDNLLGKKAKLEADNMITTVLRRNGL